jgi:hypothetical protein
MLVDFSPEDLEILRLVIADFKQLRQNAPLRSEIPNSEQTATEVYIALPPEDGIPPLTRAGAGTAPLAESGDSPGAAICTIYRIVIRNSVPELLSTGIRQNVYNLTENTIGYDWLVVARTKFGQFIVVVGSVGGDQIVRGIMTTSLSSTGTGTMRVKSWNGTDWDLTDRYETIRAIWPIDTPVTSDTLVLGVRLNNVWFGFLSPCNSSIGTGS